MAAVEGGGEAGKERAGLLRGSLVALAGLSLLGDRAVAGGRSALTLAAEPSTLAFPGWRGVVGILLFVVVGLLPAWRLVGRRLLALFLAPCLSAVLAGISAAVTVAVASEPLRWFVALAAAANAAAAASLAGPGGRGGPGSARGPRRWWAGALPWVLAAAPLGAGLVVAGLALGQQPLAQSARTHWLALAALIVHGHRALHPSLGSPGSADRLLASPLGAGVAAVTWLVTRSRSPELAVLVVGSVVLAALGAAGAGLAEIAGDGRRARGVLVAGASGVLGGAWILSAVVPLGPALVDGALGGLWVVPAVGAALLGLVVPWQGWAVRAALVLGVAGALAAPMGALAMVVLVLALVVRRRQLGRRGLLAGVVGTAGLVAGVGAAVAWPVVAAIDGAATVGFRPAAGSVLTRLGDAWGAVAGSLWPAGLGVAVALLGVLVLGRSRGVAGGGGVGLVGAGAVVLLAALGARAFDAPILRPLLETSLRDGASYAVLAGLALAGRWAAVGLGVLGRADPPGAPAPTAGSPVAAPAPTGPMGDPLDDGGPVGLHPAP